jgi:hypothetical protein
VTKWYGFLRKPIDAPLLPTCLLIFGVLVGVDVLDLPLWLGALVSTVLTLTALLLLSAATRRIRAGRGRTESDRA